MPPQIGSSALNRARDSLKLGRPKDSPYVSVNISESQHEAGTESQKLVSISLDLTLDSSLETMPSNISTQLKSSLNTSQAPPDENEETVPSMNTQPQDETDDDNDLRPTNEESQASEDSCSSGPAQAQDKSQPDSLKPNEQKIGQSDPPWRTVTIPKGALESSEYLEKLRSLAENGDGTPLLRNLTPRRAEASTSVTSVSIVEQEKKVASGDPVRKKFPLPPPSPVSSGGSEAPSQADKDGDRWLVREVSHGIKDRVRYFESMASKKAAEEEAKLVPEKEEEAVKSLKPVSSRKGNSMTMMEFLTAGWDENVPSTSENTPREEAVGTNDESECDDSVGGEAPIEEGTIEGTASQMAIRQGWMSVDWSSSMNQRIVKADEEKSHSTDTSTLPEAPTSPFLMEAQAQGLDAYMQFNDCDDGPDGSWIVDILQGLEKCECSEWLDELIMALWEDLAVYTELRRIDRKLRGKTGRCVAEWILGTEEGNYAYDSLEDSQEKQEKIVYSGEAPSLPKTTSGDWMCRGMLCERLERIPEAEQAYRVCIFKGFNLTALLGLTRIYASWGWSRESMQVCTSFHSTC